MDIPAFDDLVTDVKNTVYMALTKHFAEKGIPFDVEAYRAQSSSDRDQAAREVLFFGANIWPDENEPILIKAAA